ncbi:30S ribosomal protein S11, chloroplastic [Habropoda laboriosa]|uniref:30S ribosomal protein S11, chloroplastic n=1 Tax=Habropoda laboriosa TaxID=597456 RepID=A0A0L7R802_9HYME|nr:30S ribosomal protein S11, chloroplastic [Habropoda laboriosa]
MISSTLQIVTRSLVKNVALLKRKSTILPCLTFTHVRDMHITSNVAKEFRVGSYKVRASAKGKSAAMDGEGTVDVSGAMETVALFPDSKTPYKLFDGIPYNQLHIINIKSTHNNTIMSFTDAKLLISIHSAGIEGFKNTKKGTNVAAQQAALTFGTRILETGVLSVRLRIQGIGPGRMGCIKGFQLSGLNIVSLTDDTRVSWNPPRPRKQRRI